MGDNRKTVLIVVGMVVGSINTTAGLAQRVAVDRAPMAAASPARVSIDVTAVPLEVVVRRIARQAGLQVVYDSELTRHKQVVTMRVQDVAVTEAFAVALAGTGLRASIVDGIVAFGAVAPVAVAQGGIAGKVIDAKTRQGLHGASVSLSGTHQATTTRDDGGFHLSSVAPGTYTVQVRLLGYVKATRTITVLDGQTASLDITLEQNVSALEQVVVTGTVIPTELKAVPNAITVITAKQLEERGITRIDQLFRGDIPGMFATNQGSAAKFGEVLMFSRGVTDLTPQFSTPIKTYLDGVELSDPKYLSQIDPRSIERIEILTGPQASTIYGSNAINGVMQIFTKRGTTPRPQLTLNLQSGWVENNFSAARTPQHDYSVQASGVEGRLSYNAGGLWTYMGPWTPANQTTQLGGYGGARFDLGTPVGRLTTDPTLRRTSMQNRQRGSAVQRFTAYTEDGLWNGTAFAGIDIPATYTLTGQTMGITVQYAPMDWWSHELKVGQDVSDTETRQTGRGYRYLNDTTLMLQQNHASRMSLSYTTTARIPVTSLASATITLGADGWHDLTSVLYVQPQALTGTLTGATQVSRQPGHNTGGFLQMLFGVDDRLFFTYGVRAEWNPDFGDEAQPNYAPRFGVTYTQDVAAVTVKFRASYGRSTRPPAVGQKIPIPNSITDITPVYGPFNSTIANPLLGPEYQQGGEGGIEVYLGSRASLVVTRYNQTVDGLIINVPGADSVRSLQPNPLFFGVLTCAQMMEFNLPTYCASQDEAGYGYALLSQNLNAASIRNQGWELTGSLVTGAVTTRATYSWTKSRAIGVAPQYRQYFTGAAYRQYQPGATFQFLPEHTWAVGTTYAHAATTLALTITGTGLLRSVTDAFALQHLYYNIRLPQNLLNMSSGAGSTAYPTYTSFNRGYAMADLTAAQRFSPRVEGLVQIQNVADRYVNDYDMSNAVLGRQVKLGVRIR